MALGCSVSTPFSDQTKVFTVWTSRSHKQELKGIKTIERTPFPVCFIIVSLWHSFGDRPHSLPSHAGLRLPCSLDCRRVYWPSQPHVLKAMPGGRNLRTRWEQLKDWHTLSGEAIHSASCGGGRSQEVRQGQDELRDLLPLPPPLYHWHVWACLFMKSDLRAWTAVRCFCLCGRSCGWRGGEESRAEISFSKASLSARSHSAFHHLVFGLCCWSNKISL